MKDFESDLLFVYGSLLRPENEFAVLLKSNSLLLGKGKVRGSLFDLGAYPGAVFGKEHTGHVHGHFVRMNGAAGIWEELDNYEGCGQEDAQPHEFVRQLIVIEMNAQQVSCWAYSYNLSTDGLKMIDNGDYLGYLNP